MKTNILFLAVFLSINSLFSQNIKSPQEFLGYELGTRFSRHHQVVDYYKYVSNTLSNVLLEKYGETNEHRPLYLSYISSKENISNIENIRKNNLNQTVSGKNSNNIAIVWLSYNVHGNEASSTEASMQTLYELVTKKQNWLKNTLVIIDPCINPDGRDRYVNWFNQVKSTPFNVTQAAKEHVEPWPSGRPNHYLFDLNRDWAWLTQVESAQRIQIYNKWMPHIHVDFHEQGINEPYYFAPAAAPFHEVISDWQKEFQTQIGKNHARHFDKESWLYFTRERFDLFYPSYGDTYPTFMGAIGMTYEQAGHGRAGLGITTDEGEVLTLKDRIAHHKTTGLSTVEISSKNAIKLNAEFSKFFKNHTTTYKSYVLQGSVDKISKLTSLLNKHEIIYGFAKKSTVKGYDFNTQKEVKKTISSDDLVVSINQPKGKMVQALFEPKGKLEEPLTYDITAWSLPYAYGFNAIASKTLVKSSVKNINNKVLNTADKNAYAYVAKWNHIKDATFLSQLLKENIKVRFTEKPFTAQGKSYNAGTLIITRNDNKKNTNFDTTLIKIANSLHRKVTPIASGFVDKGPDFGSYSVKSINKQKIALLSGEGTSSLSFGEIWHFFETQLNYPITLLDTKYFSRVDLSNYDVIIIPNGYYGSVLTKSTLANLKKWTRKGGTLIVIQNALKSFADKKGFALKSKKAKKDTISPNLTPYNMRERKSVENFITGSVFNSKVDNTHPFGFGYSKQYFSLKLSPSSYKLLQDGNNVAYFGKNTKSVSGFSGEKALKNIPESLLFGEEKTGSGSIIYMVDNPLFRSFWENGKLFLANAVFLTNSDKLRL